MRCELWSSPRPYNLSVKQVLGAALLALAFGAAAADGQARKPTPPAEEIPTYTESVGTEYVLLPVVIFDKKGRFAEGIEQSDFQVWVEGKSVGLDTFDKDDDAPSPSPSSSTPPAA